MGPRDEHRWAQEEAAAGPGRPGEGEEGLGLGVLRLRDEEALSLEHVPLSQSPCPSCRCSPKLRRQRRGLSSSGCAAWGGRRGAGS